MSTPVETLSWQDDDQLYSSVPLNAIRTALENHISFLEVDRDLDEGSSSKNELKEISKTIIELPGLKRLCDVFDLSSFEQNILLLCAGMELDACFAQLCAEVQENEGRPYPTFSLAMHVFQDSNWSAITPASPLRYWRLIDIIPGSTLLLSQLRIDERILYYLKGVDHLDERLSGLIELVSPSSNLVPSHRQLADRAIKIWSEANDDDQLPVVYLYGRDITTKRAISSAICEKLGQNLGLLSALSLPTNPDELEALIRLWEREAALSARVLFLECDETDLSDKIRAATITRLAEKIRSPLIVSSIEKLGIRGRAAIVLEVRTPSSEEQRMLWKCYMSEFSESSDKHTQNHIQSYIQNLTSQFDLSSEEIQAAFLQASDNWYIEDSGICQEDSNREHVQEIQEIIQERLWDACRDQSHPRLDDLAQRIKTLAEKEDLVLPEAQLRMLDDIVAHVRQRFTVYEKWGFASKSRRSLGISALFSGGSGTGKTLAAEVLANELKLDLYRIDLSQVVSKYIGETEKNLKRVFDAAEAGGAILLFDEADALFGKRSEVRDSHDRYANIEISYLLQRMEAYRGLAILTTNMKEALDKSFLRRIRFVIDFPFPDSKQRAEIWERIFPSDTPTSGLDFDKLARLNIAGGNIKNIALYAAFLAANSDKDIDMNLLLRAAYIEYAKLDRQLTAAELGSWKWIPEEA